MPETARPTAPVVVAHAPTRAPWRAHWPAFPDAPRPPIAEVVAGLAGAPLAWLGGGEPTLRADLPRLLRACAAEVDELGMITDGLALVAPAPLQALRDAGLGRLRIHLHSAKAEVHDWLVGQKGAGRRARKAIQTARKLGIPTEVDLLLSRPGSPWLVPTIQLLAGLGVARVHLRRPLRRGRADPTFISASPRLGLLQQHLDQAIVEAHDRGLALQLHGIPRCAAPRATDAHMAGAPEAVVWPAALAGLPAVADWGSAPPAPACGACEGPPHCPGAPADYVDRFGDTELRSERPGPLRRPVPAPPVFGQTPPVPPPRKGRSPATRPHVAGRLAAWPDVGGDPLAGQPGGAPTLRATLTLRGPTRALRLALVRLAQDGVQEMTLVAPAPDPETGELVREAQRLSFPRLHLIAGPRALTTLSARQLSRLRGLTRVEVGLDDPATAAEVAAHIADVAQQTGAPVAPVAWFAAPPAPADPSAWAAAWEAAWTVLPGTPQVRCAPGLDPADLAALAAAAPAPAAWADALRRASPLDGATG